MKCDECKFWQTHLPRTNTSGFCKRYPPQLQPVVAKDADVNIRWGVEPITANDDWCGEFQAKENSDTHYCTERQQSDVAMAKKRVDEKEWFARHGIRPAANHRKALAMLRDSVDDAVVLQAIGCHHSQNLRVRILKIIEAYKQDPL